MKLVCLLCGVFACVVGSALAGTCMWTGNGGDYKWSTAANWSGNAAPVDGDSVTIIAVRDGVADPTAIVNDIKGLTLNNLTFALNGTAAASAAITLDGEAIALERTSGSSWNMVVNCSGIAVSNHCALVFKPHVPESADKQGINLSNGTLHQFGDITSSATTFSIVRSSSPSPTFYGKIEAPLATLTAKGGTMAFFGRVRADILVSDGVGMSLRASDCSARLVRFPSAGDKNKYFDVYALTSFEGATFVWDFDNVQSICRLFCDAALDRLSGVAATNATGQIVDANCQRVMDFNSAKRALTLRASQSDETWACLCGTLSLTYAPKGDYTLNLAGRVHTTTGALKVNGGTLRLTHGGCFPNVTDVTVEKDATLDVASKNANNATLSANARLVLATGAKLAVSNACDLTVKTLVYGGVPVMAKTYTAADCDWLIGAGSVTVTSADTGATYWKSAANGKWTDADNWTEGAPTASTRAYVLADGADYTVTLDEELAAPKVFAVRNGGTGKATVKVVEGGSWLAADVTDYQIGRNGEWFVDGGWASVSNNSSMSSFRFVVSGDEGATGVVKVASGTLKLAIDDRNQMKLSRWGRIDATGGEVDMLASRRYNGYTTLLMAGGEINVSGGVQWKVNNNSGLMTHRRMTLGGTSVFSGTSYVNASANKTVGLNAFGVMPRDDNDGDALLEFKDQAVLDTRSEAFLVSSCQRGAESEFRYSSSGRSPIAGLSWDKDYFCYSINAGGNGRGRFYMSDGELRPGSYGVAVGGGLSDTDAWGDGLLEISGGHFYMLGSSNAGAAQGRLSGLAVGYGAFFKTDTTFATRPFEGTVRVKDTGRVYLREGYLTIGAGYGKGRWEQSGGATTNAAQALSVGLAGGLGSIILSNGTFRTGVTYLGGALTNAFTLTQTGGGLNAGAMLVPNGHYPIDRHDGVGTLTVAGGAFLADYREDSGVLLGQDGDGTIEMVGTDGVFKANYLIASNFVAGAGTPTSHRTQSTLKFTFGADGVSPLDVTGAATLTEGTRIVVDFSDYAGTKTRFRLVNAGTSDFDVDDLAVTFVDDNVEAHGTKISDMSLVKDGRGLLFRSGRSGLAFVIR